MAVTVGAAVFVQQRSRTSRVAIRATAGAETAEHGCRVGMKVRVVAEGVKLFHVAKNDGVFDPRGLTGEIVEVLEHDHLTPNRPLRVKLEIPPATSGGKIKRFITHFEFDELCFYSHDYRPCEDEAKEASSTAVSSSTTGAVPPSVAMSSSPASGQRVALSALGSSGTLSVPAGEAVLQDERWQINLLYDGECPSCMKQVEFLQKRMDENPEYAGLIRFTDLTHPAYNPETLGGVVFEDGMRHLHAVMRDGEVVIGMEAFRRIYSTVGMEWVHMATTLPVVGSICDWLYDLFAEYRLQLNGQTDALERVRKHKQRIEELSHQACTVECEINWNGV